MLPNVFLGRLNSTINTTFKIFAENNNRYKSYIKNVRPTPFPEGFLMKKIPSHEWCTRTKKLLL